MFINNSDTQNSSWQSFERLVDRLLIAEGFDGARVVGQTGDHGADVLASKNKQRWLFQVKRWKAPVGVSVIDETIRAASAYGARIPVIVASSGFDSAAKEQQRTLQLEGIPLQLWDVSVLVQHANRIVSEVPNTRAPRPYQDNAIESIVSHFICGTKKAMVVMATGLGKTFVAAESVRRINKNGRIRTLVLAHTNPLVYQLEKSFWCFMTKEQRSVVWNGYEGPTPTQLETYDYVFACVNTVAEYIDQHHDFPTFDMVIVDECHHAGADMYGRVLDETRAGKPGGPFLLGLTATPWRPDEKDLASIFGEVVVCIDMVRGLREGFLANVDYRMYTDNIDWKALRRLKGKAFTPKQINKTLFIEQWDDSVVYALQRTWHEQPNPRAIVFCGTIDHANIMCNKLNTLGFCNAAAIYSNSGNGYSLSQYEKNKILSDFQDGLINVVCTVDIFNEGIDVPDVNLLVFQRVTHSRRIFIQQLGRGLRISDGKDKVTVLDFVSDIRRFAAGLSLKDGIEVKPDRNAIRINLPNTVTFRRATGDDPETEQFLRLWLDDIAAIEESGENSSVLKFPPVMPASKR